MRLMQSKVLPENWLDLIREFDIEKSSLSDNNKIIADYLMPIILEENEKSLRNPLMGMLIKFIVFGSGFLEHYDNLPPELIREVFDEIKKQRGTDLDRELHSRFVEFKTYQDLCNQGYQITDYKREDGSCDLIMSKGGEIYNFEVKFKESPDIGISRLHDYIDGCSLLNENDFLRGGCFEINLKVNSLRDDNLKIILSEIDDFISAKEDIYDGQNLQIFNSKKTRTLNRDGSQVTKYISKFHIQVENDVDGLVDRIFMQEKCPLAKLINKSKNYKPEDNFTGCLVWAIPFHKDVDKDKIKQAFEKLTLGFDLFVYTVGVNRDEFNFFVPK